MVKFLSSVCLLWDVAGCVSFCSCVELYLNDLNFVSWFLVSSNTKYEEKLKMLVDSLLLGRHWLVQVSTEHHDKFYFMSSFLSFVN